MPPPPPTITTIYHAGISCNVADEALGKFVCKWAQIGNKQTCRVTKCYSYTSHQWSDSSADWILVVVINFMSRQSDQHLSLNFSFAFALRERVMFVGWILAFMYCLVFNFILIFRLVFFVCRGNIVAGACHIAINCCTNGFCGVLPQQHCKQQQQQQRWTYSAEHFENTYVHTFAKNVITLS